MDFATISDFVNNVGFPITCVCAMFYMCNKEREAHKEESSKFTEALNNNTLVVQKLVDKVDNLKVGE